MFALTRHERLAQEIRRSRFLARAAPIDGEADARRLLAEWSDGQASHNCWAWRVGAVYRFNDDGEPSGTAGKPILQAIDGQELDRVLVVVTRWFGGVLLGAGGLIRAYGGTAAACLRAAEKVPLVDACTLALDCRFADLALVQARLQARAGVTIEDQVFNATGATIRARLPETEADAVAAALIEETGGRLAVSRVDE
ncbi:YigZ family protein [Aureimonas flava]|uniref:YigZ family protein n=1 Tax=Aureimonas flava TaxID=2320271 RepID=A0A3A1WL23_9HYPH|nr:YigZ family protein [Aureimonas flava]RIY01012.1 YigZ family protein [Aureimonas flava]